MDNLEGLHHLDVDAPAEAERALEIWKVDEEGKRVFQHVQESLEA